MAEIFFVKKVFEKLYKKGNCLNFYKTRIFEKYFK